MKVTSATLGPRFGARLLWITVLVALALGITLALLLTRGSVAADGQDEFTAPIVLEEIRTPPKVVEPPSVRDVPSIRQVQAAQTSTTLISNNGRTLGQVIGIVSEQAQSFTTGSNSFGYRVTSVDVRVNPTSTQSNYSVSIRANSSGIPGATLGTLTKSGSLSTPNSWTLVSFPASGDGVDLDANTTYWVVASVNGAVRMHTTNVDSEDPGGAAGWSMGDVRLFNFPNWDPSNSDTGAIRLAVIGYAKTKATPIDRLSQPPRDPITVTYDGETVEAKAFSAERDTLWDYFESECTRLRSVSDPYRDYSLFDADGRRIQASNGWKWVYVQNSQGDVTGSTPMTVSQCASLKLYQRQAFCDQYANRQGPNEQKLCPTYRTW